MNTKLQWAVAVLGCGAYVSVGLMASWSPADAEAPHALPTAVPVVAASTTSIATVTGYTMRGDAMGDAWLKVPSPSSPAARSALPITMS